MMNLAEDLSLQLDESTDVSKDAQTWLRCKASVNRIEGFEKRERVMSADGGSV